MHIICLLIKQTEGFRQSTGSINAVPPEMMVRAAQLPPSEFFELLIFSTKETRKVRMICFLSPPRPLCCDSL